MKTTEYQSPMQLLTELVHIPLLSKGLFLWLPESIGTAIETHCIRICVTQTGKTFWFQRDLTAFTADEELVIQYPGQLSKSVSLMCTTLSRMCVESDEVGDDGIGFDSTSSFMEML